MAITEAYCDASATGKDERRVRTLATLVNTQARWLRFETAWAKAMERGGAAGKILHMTDLVGGYRAFNEWKLPAQTGLLKRLVPLVRRGILWGHCDSFPLANWEGPEPTHPGHATTMTLLIQGTIEHLIERVRPTPAEPIHFYMEEDHLVEYEMTQHFYYVTKGRGWDKLFPLIKPLPKGPGSLQAADLVAYEASRYASECWFWKLRNPRRSFLELARRHGPVKFFYTTKQNFESYRAKVERAYAELSTEKLADLEAAFTAASKQTNRERSRAAIERKRARKGNPK